MSNTVSFIIRAIDMTKQGVASAKKQLNGLAQATGLKSLGALGKGAVLAGIALLAKSIANTAEELDESGKALSRWQRQGVQAVTTVSGNFKTFFGELKGGLVSASGAWLRWIALMRETVKEGGNVKKAWGNVKEIFGGPTPGDMKRAEEQLKIIHELSAEANKLRDKRKSREELMGDEYQRLARADRVIAGGAAADPVAYSTAQRDREAALVALQAIEKEIAKEKADAEKQAAKAREDAAQQEYEDAVAFSDARSDAANDEYEMERDARLELEKEVAEQRKKYAEESVAFWEKVISGGADAMGKLVDDQIAARADMADRARARRREQDARAITPEQFMQRALDPASRRAMNNEQREKDREEKRLRTLAERGARKLAGSGGLLNQRERDAMAAMEGRAKEDRALKEQEALRKMSEQMPGDVKKILELLGGVGK
jgi:hypothetical protein